MLNLLRLKEFLTEAKNTIDGINFTTLVIDDSELTAFLKEREPEDNSFLIAVVPMHTVSGYEDNFKWVNKLQFMILEKSSDKNFENHDDYIDMFARTQALGLQFVNLIFNNTSDNGTMCGLFNEVDFASMQMDVVWRKAQCNGYEIIFDMQTNG